MTFEDSEMPHQHATQKLTNDIIKPWDELNKLLVQRYAFQPELSDVTRYAESLAVAISHFPEKLGLTRPAFNSRSPANQLMTDVADKAKHGTLNNTARDNSLYVAANFEVNNMRKFRFVRNTVFVNHCSLGKHDFMSESLSAINFLMGQLRIQMKQELKLEEAPSEFHDTAFLYYNPQFCIKMQNTRYNFLRREPGGDLMLFDPPEVKIEIFEMVHGQ